MQKLGQKQRNRENWGLTAALDGASLVQCEFIGCMPVVLCHGDRVAALRWARQTPRTAQCRLLAIAPFSE
eukprot:4956319-Amphidinium_carterae.1